MAIGLTSILTTYLNQWLKVASKENVVLSRYATGGLQNFIVFKCKCGTNWNVGENLFYNIADPASSFIPSELQDWVKEHRHVCKKYVNSCSGIQGECATCKWPYGAHEESWIDAKPINDWSKIKASGMALPGPSVGFVPAQKSKIVPPLPEVKGRKFRD